MNNFSGLYWFQTLFLETSFLIFFFLFSISACLFFFRKKGPKLLYAWVSLKSWLFVTPITLFAAGLPPPYPIIILTLIAMYSAKTFFRMVGIYHRTYFVMTCYLFIALMAYCIHQQLHQLIPLLPMIYLLFLTTIPIIKNSFAHTLQYLALALLAFMFFGWSIMHFGLIFKMSHGIYIIMYLYILSELNENTLRLFNSWVHHIKKKKPLLKVAPRLTLEGFFAAFALTMGLAWALRHLLPSEDAIYWITAALIVSILGRLGVLSIATLRKDLGLKDYRGPFIIGRDDILSILDKLIFIGPAFYYVLLLLKGQFIL